MSAMRIGGLASGMDIDQIVSDLMKAERMPLNKLKQQKQILEWQRDDYRDMNKLLLDLKNLAFDMTLQQSYLAKKTSSSDDSKVTATAVASAGNASYEISNVTRATAATNVGYDVLSGAAKIDPNKSIWEIKGNFNAGPGFNNLTNTDIWKKKPHTNNTISVNANGNKFKLEKGAIDNAVDGSTITVSNADGSTSSYTVSTTDTTPTSGQVYLNTNTGELTFGNTLTKGSKINSFSYDHYTINFSITTYDENGNPIGNNKDDNDGKYDFEFDATTSLNKMMSDITNSGVGIAAFYDSVQDKVVFTRKETGNFNSDLNRNNGKEMIMNSDFLKYVLKVDHNTPAPGGETGGTDAQFTLNGLTTTRHSNTFTINGVDITLKSNFTDVQSINIQNDTEKAFENIKNFIEKYNEVIEKINEKTSQTKYRDYKPLSDEEKEAMNEKQIELWEEKAKSGLLRNDSILTSGLNRMRLDFYSSVSTVSNPDYDQLSEIGIKTSSNYLDKGKLIIDETKLKEALSKDTNAVMELFTASGETTSEKGIARRLRETIDATIKKIEEKAGNALRTNDQFSIGKSLNDVDEKIDSFEERLTQIEDRYWRQFTAMEKAIQQANSQSMYMMQQFGGGF